MTAATDATKNVPPKKSQSCFVKFIYYTTIFVAVIWVVRWTVREVSLPPDKVCPYIEPKTGVLSDSKDVYDAEKNIKLIWHIGGIANSIIAKHNIAYVMLGPELAALDTTNPSDIKRIGYTLFPDEYSFLGKLIYIDEYYAYVIYENFGGYHGGASLWRVDISNPAKMSAERIYRVSDPNEYIVSVKILGKRAYVTTRHFSHFYWIDIGDPVNIPARSDDILYIINSASNKSSVTCYQGVWSGGIRMILKFIARELINAPKSSHDGDRYYSITDEGWIKISNQDMTEIGSYSAPYSYENFFSYGSYGYLTLRSPESENWALSLHLVDISNITDPKYLGKLPFKPIEITESNQYAFVQAGYHQPPAEVFDMAQPTSKKAVALSNEISEITNMTIVKNRAYARTNDGHFLLLDMTEVTQPKVIVDHDYSTGEQVDFDIVAAEDFAYIIFDTRVDIFNISNEKNIMIVGSFECKICSYNENIKKLIVKNKFAFIIAGNKGVEIFDISNPAAPNSILVYDQAGPSVNDFIIVNNYLYISSFKGLQILDISNPAHPSLVYSMKGNGADNLNVENDYLYLTFDNGLEIFDVSNPTHPSIAGSFLTGGIGRYSVNCNHIYISDSDGGFFILEIKSARLNNCSQ